MADRGRRHAKCLRPRRRCVTSSSDHGVVAYGPCRASFRRSTSSSPPWDGRPSSTTLLSSSRSRLRLRSDPRRRPERRRLRRRDPRLLALPIARRAPLGLSRARNVGLGRVEADVVAFPDDDCTYSPGLLRRSASDSRPTDARRRHGTHGRRLGRDAVSSSWRADPGQLDRENLWNRAISFTIFLRRSVIASVGRVRRAARRSDRGTPWHSAEEIDYLVRAIRTSARSSSTTLRSSSATTCGRTIPAIGSPRRRERRLPAAQARLPGAHGGAGCSCGRSAASSVADATRLAGACYQLATLRGRVRGYLGARRSKISA